MVADLCPECGAYWPCEHKEPEEGREGLREYDEEGFVNSELDSIMHSSVGQPGTTLTRGMIDDDLMRIKGGADASYHYTNALKETFEKRLRAELPPSAQYILDQTRLFDWGAGRKKGEDDEPTPAPGD